MCSHNVLAPVPSPSSMTKSVSFTDRHRRTKSSEALACLTPTETGFSLHHDRKLTQEVLSVTVQVACFNYRGFCPAGLRATLNVSQSTLCRIYLPCRKTDVVWITYLKIILEDKVLRLIKGRFIKKQFKQDCRLLYKMSLENTKNEILLYVTQRCGLCKCFVEIVTQSLFLFCLSVFCVLVGFSCCFVVFFYLFILMFEDFQPKRCQQECFLFPSIPLIACNLSLKKQKGEVRVRETKLGLGHDPHIEIL